MSQLNLGESSGRLQSFLHTFNEEKNYIKCHHIARDMLIHREDQKLSKLLACLAGLAEQSVKGKEKGYQKFKYMIKRHFEEMPEHPFDESDFYAQLKLLDQVMDEKGSAEPMLRLKLR